MDYLLLYYLWNIVYSFVVLSMLIHIYHRMNSRYERFSRQMDTLRQIEERTEGLSEGYAEGLSQIDETTHGYDLNYGTNQDRVVV